VQLQSSPKQVPPRSVPVIPGGSGLFWYLSKHWVLHFSGSQGWTAPGSG